MSALENIEQRCRFVFNHLGSHVGITTDATLAREARELGLSVSGYVRDRVTGLTEYEIRLGTAT